MSYKSRSGAEREGRYVMTIDWCSPDGFGFAETPGQHKCGHIIALDDGNYALQPNNRVHVFEPSYTTQYRKPICQRLVSDRIYTAEDQPRYVMTDGEAYDTPTADTGE